MIALGAAPTGPVQPDDGLASALQAAGDAALDPAGACRWTNEYDEAPKSNFADMANVAAAPAARSPRPPCSSSLCRQLRWTPGHRRHVDPRWGATGRPGWAAHAPRAVAEGMTSVAFHTGVLIRWLRLPPAAQGPTGKVPAWW